MTQAWLNRTGIAVPPHDIHAEFVEFGRTTVADPHQRALFDRMARLADIEHRYSFLEPGPKPRDQVLDSSGFYRRGAFPSTGARMALFQPQALILAMRAIEQTFADVDVVVTPTFGAQLVATNLTGHPAVIVPNGFRDDGTPVSLTFLGRLYGEAPALALARAYQNHTGFHLKHPDWLMTA